jgi:hypothetical protein
MATTTPTAESVFRAVNSIVKPLVRLGIGSPMHVGPGVVMLETTGRVSGKKREVPLLGFRLGNRVVVSTVRADSHWLRNAEANDETAVWLCGSRHDSKAAVARGPLNVATLSLTDPK